MNFDQAGNRKRVSELCAKGVEVWGPERVYVDSSVDLDAIEAGAVVRQATLSGSTLSIGAGSVIGTSGHAEVDDCQIGRNVELGSGMYHSSTFLDGVKIRGFAEIRPGTLLEEEVDLAHCVALKNTTFTACCVAGSLINFCDVFLSGGTSRRDHTEVGSAAVHYNFDPWGDKWGSLLGGIRGVLLREDPVFIGGTCGIVGPVEIGFGAVLAAGSTIRRSVSANTLVATSSRNVKVNGFDRRKRGSVARAFVTTARLVATLRAFDSWYKNVRLPYSDSRERTLYAAARGRIEAQASERIKRLRRVVSILGQGDGAAAPWAKPTAREHAHLVRTWEEMRRLLEARLDEMPPPSDFMRGYRNAREGGLSHLEAVRAAPESGHAEAWLQGLVEGITIQAKSLVNYEVSAGRRWD